VRMETAKVSATWERVINGADAVITLQTSALYRITSKR
jgi:hypothetical protein